MCEGFDYVLGLAGLTVSLDDGVVEDVGELFMSSPG